MTPSVTFRPFPRAPRGDRLAFELARDVLLEGAASPGFGRIQQGGTQMTNHEQFEQILERAKQGRAEVVASAVKTRGVRLAVVATLALVLVQFMIEPILV